MKVIFRIPHNLNIKNLYLILVFFLALLPRVYKLNKFPPSMIHDELNYVMNAKSLWTTGKNIPLTASALFSWGESEFDVVISELPSLIIAPWVGINDLSQLNVRIFYAFLSSLSVVLIYLIVETLLNKEVAFFTGFVAAFNPWSIHIGRTALEVNFAIFFFLLGTLLFLRSKTLKTLFAFPFFLAGFLSYLGAKLHFFPWIMILLIYKWLELKEENKKKGYLLIFGILSFAVLVFYTLTLSFQPAGSRKGELTFFNESWASKIVDTERRLAIPNQGLRIFSNKLTVTLKRAGDVYLKAFSTVGLFSRGETVSVYSLWEYGQFHFLDFILILVGFVGLYFFNRRIFWLISFLVLLGPWVSAIDLVEETYAIRAFPTYIFLWVFAGFGFWYLSKSKRQKLIFSLILILYFFSIAYFINLYLYRYPIYSAERWFFSERILSSYIKRVLAKYPGTKIYVSSVESPKIVFENFLFYTGLYNTKDQVIYANSRLKDKVFGIGNVTFMHGCPFGSEKDISPDYVLISHQRFKCLEESQERRGIVDLKDAGTVFVISDDKLCRGFELPRYYRPMNDKIFDIESLSDEDFCRNWIVAF